MRKRQWNTHERIADAEAPKGSSDRGFGIVFAAVFAIVGSVNAYKGGSWWPGLFAASALTLAAAFLAPSLLHPFNRVWTAFGLLLHKVVNPVVMAVVFVIGVMPTALIMRLLGKGSLQLGFDKSARSYWHAAEQAARQPDSFKRQF